VETNQERFKADKVEVGDELKVVRNGDGGDYKVSFVNQVGFEVAEIPVGTKVSLDNPISFGVPGMNGQKFEGVVTTVDGQTFIVNAQNQTLKFWSGDKIKIVEIPKINEA